MLSPEQALRFRETYGDKRWRLENLYKIRTKRRTVERLRFNRIQGLLWDRTRDMSPVRHFTLKYRQGGVSTFWLLYWLDDTMFRRNTQTVVLAHKRESLDHLWAIVRLAYDTMPDRAKPPAGTDRANMLSFPDIGSNIMVSLEVRSTAAHNVHISEWCLADDGKVRATLGAAGPDANVTGESTGNGIGNDGYQTYQDSKLAITAGGNGFGHLFIPWYLQEEYAMPSDGVPVERTSEEVRVAQEAKRDYGLELSDGQVLYRRHLERTHKRMRPQEFPENDQEAFLASGFSFFDGRKLIVLDVEAADWARKNPYKATEDYVQWEAPQPGHVYVAGADVAEGLQSGPNGENDFSVLAILCVTCRRQAFRYRARVGVDAFYRILDEWGRAYHNALLAPERNNHGHAVILGLREITNYPNLYEEKKDTRVILKGHPVQKERRFGWHTSTQDVKTAMCDRLKIAMEGDSQEDERHFRPEFMVLDRVLLSEALTFQNIDGKLSGAAGKFDDTVMAWAITTEIYLQQRRSDVPSRLGDFLVGGMLESG